MKKTMIAISAAFLTVVSLGLGGCSGDDDPVDPPLENCAITVTSPVAGESFRPGDPDLQTINIRWEETGDADLVAIELLKDSTLVGVIHPSVPNNNGFYRWTANTLGTSNGSTFAIRVSAVGEDDCQGISGLFTLTNTTDCSLYFTNQFPDTLVAGEVFNLTWDGNNTTGNVDILLRKRGTDFEGFIAESIEDGGSFDWTVDSLHNGTFDNYFLRIRDSVMTGCYSDSVDFRLEDDDICYIDVSTPTDGQVLEEGTEYGIYLQAADEVNFVDLRLYKGNEFLGHIGSHLPVADFPYIWTVSDFDNIIENTRYRIRVTNSDDQYCEGDSSDFTIISQ